VHGKVPRAGDFSPIRNGFSTTVRREKPVIAAPNSNGMRILDQLSARLCSSNL